ncbi:hypothetical protein NDU88_006109 [Pleurodeles waltl]|uniref:Uncharacterized protein n=1 Tax=Pleurodeles waltl TaxID=8319 RepID=A0AAV7TWP4_PLEWA|nr:hypothetical protein NDU88_006109 [Pleurodeles waltl]
MLSRPGLPPCAPPFLSRVLPLPPQHPSGSLLSHIRVRAPAASHGFRASPDSLRPSRSDFPSLTLTPGLVGAPGWQNLFPLRLCDGSDRFDPHTRATGAAAVGDDPEVTLRSHLPIGSFHHLRDSGNLKGEVPEIKGVWRSEEEMVQETSGEEPPKRVKTQRRRGTLGASRIPEVEGQAELRSSMDRTWDEARRPWEATP